MCVLKDCSGLEVPGQYGLVEIVGFQSLILTSPVFSRVTGFSSDT